MDEKLDKILENQQAIYNKLSEIFELLQKIDKHAWISNYTADIAGTVTAELGLTDMLRSIKK